MWGLDGGGSGFRGRGFLGLGVGGGVEIFVGDETGEVAFVEALENLPEDGDECCAYYGVEGHSEYYGCADLLTAVGSGSAGKHHGHDSEDEGAGGHHDRSEADYSGIVGGLTDRYSGFAEVHGVFYNQNRVLG